MREKDLDQKEQELKGCAEVARELGIAESEVRAWARNDGGVPRVGPVFVFREGDVDRLEEDLVDEADYEANPEDEEDGEPDYDGDELDDDEDMDDDDGNIDDQDDLDDEDEP